MIRNYLKVAFREIAKNKIFAFINIGGLSISLAACMVVLVYVLFEFGFDTFHSNADRIYRLQMDIVSGTIRSQNAATYPATKNIILNQFPDIEEIVRIKQKKGIVIAEHKSESSVRFSEDNIFYVDEEFLKVFSFPLIAGDRKSALSSPNSVILTESMAKKYFGASRSYDNIIGELLRKIGTTEDETLVITGICKDVPENSHFIFDFLISYKSIYGWRDDDGSDYKSLAENSIEWPGFYTYILVKKTTSESKIRDLEKSMSRLFASGVERGQFTKYEIVLQPLRSIHLLSQLEGEFQKNGDRNSVYLLTLVTILLLVMAIINHVNLSSAKTSERFKEVSVRKALGSDRKQIIMRFVLESLLVTFVSTLIAIFLFVIFWLTLRGYFGIEFDFAFWNEPRLLCLILATLILSTIIYSIYPITLLSSYNPIKVLHGGVVGIKGVGLRKALVVFQFFIAALLVSGALTIYKQMRYMQEADTGVKINNILVLKAPKIPTDRANYLSASEAFKTKLTGLAAIKNVSAGVRIPGEVMSTQTVNRLTDKNGGQVMNILGVDQDYLKTLELKIIAGRDFSRNLPENQELVQFNEFKVNFGSNDHSVIITESASKLLGFTDAADAIGQAVYLFGAKKVIIGVVGDYHHQSLKEDFKATVFYVQLVYANCYILSFENTSDIQRIISDVNEAWNIFYPKDPFEYFFLNDFYNSQCRDDNKFQTVFTSLTVLTVFISCLGLFALSLFMIARRSKEIAIRKIVGASVRDIIITILGDFLRLVLIGLIVSIPISFVVFSKWLENYPNRISLGLWFFCMPFAIVIVISISIVLYQTTIAARANAVRYLKYE